MSNGKRILIVDDDEDLVGMLSDQLKLHEEFQVTTSLSAADSLEIVKSWCFRHDFAGCGAAGYGWP